MICCGTRRRSSRSSRLPSRARPNRCCPPRPGVEGLPIVTDPYVHLHVASGYSLRYGASSPQTLVDRAAEHGMDALALTDRDGVYGAVRFVKACSAAGIRPVLGVDLGLPATTVTRTEARRTGAGQRRSPARGGAFVEPDRPRITV